jgi:signal transduction histidine kinase
LSDYIEWQDGTSSKAPEAESIAMSQDMAAMFKRASNLIRESIAVEGCVFLDASGTTTEHIAVDHRPEVRESISASTLSERKSTNEDKYLRRNTIPSEADGGRRPTTSRGNSFQQASMCEVLGYSSKFNIHPTDGIGTPDFQFPKGTLHRMLEKYPDGGILNFEENGSVTSGEEEFTTIPNDSPTMKDFYSITPNKDDTQVLKEADGQTIMNTFPGIRRLAFFPLWDTSTKTWFCGALAWTNDPLRILDAEDDMAYLAAFGNSIMAKKAQLEASMADRMKSNFISTVSHELRSPLHGILASTEMLKDMSLDIAQMDVISMINVCGRTLLDTINHVLDFTELNRLRKATLLEEKKRDSRDVSKAPSHSTPNSFKQTADLDLSLLVEEVVDSTLAGHDFGRTNSLIMLNSHSQSHSIKMHSSSGSHNLGNRANNSVRVIIDIDWRLNWVFSLQPGAWRRIVMNLFGNALKYTKNGYVCVSLRSIDNQDSQPIAILTVKDTGKGISKEFLKRHIFKPFWQEDSLATGTGLGLSIVQQIIHDLGGHVEIKSKEGSGTQVTVQIPLGITPPSRVLGSKNDDDLLHTIRQKMKGLRVHIVSPKSASQIEKQSASEIPDTYTARSISIRNTLCKTLKGWFEVKIVESLSIDFTDADVYLLLADEIDATIEPTQNRSLVWESEVTKLIEANALMVLCTSPASLSQKASELLKSTHIIQQP